MNFTDPIKNNRKKPLWTNEFSPNNINDIVGNQEIIKNIGPNNFVSILLIGPHGCGKSTFAKLIAKNALGNNVKTNLLELYSSINRNKVYTNNKLIIDNKNIDDFIHSANSQLKLKIIIVYDIDTTPADTQHLFLNLLRDNNLRIIFTANNTHTLSDTLLCNIMVINMTQLYYSEIFYVMNKVCDAKNLKLCEDVQRAICINCNGDIRKLFNILQLVSGIDDLSLDNFYKLVDIPSYECIKLIINNCKNGNANGAYMELNSLLQNGYDITDIFDIIEKTLLYMDILDPDFPKEDQDYLLMCATNFIMFKNHNKIQLYSMINTMLNK